jgi:hypothetical protein
VRVAFLPTATSFTISEIEIIYDALLFRPSVVGQLGTKHDLHPRLRYRLKELAEGLDRNNMYNMFLPFDNEVADVIPYALEHCEFFTHGLDDVFQARYLCAKLKLEYIYDVKIPE